MRDSEKDEPDKTIWTSPLDPEHRLLFAEMKELEGFALAWSYATAAEERRSALSHTVISDISPMGKLRLAGKAVDPFLYGMFECDFDTLTVIGAGVMATMNPDVARGRFSEGTVVRVEIIRSGEHEFMLLVRFDQVAAVYSLLSEYAECGDDEDSLEEGQIFLGNESDSLAGICLAGPKAMDILGEMGREMDGGAGLEVAGMGEFTLGMLYLDTAPTLIFHCGLTCYHLFVPPSYARGLWRGLLSFPEVTPIGFDAFASFDIFAD